MLTTFTPPYVPVLLAQIEAVGNAATKTLASAGEVGVVVVMAVFLIVLALVVGGVAWLAFRDRAEARKSRAKQEAEDATARERREIADREARKAEREALSEALSSSNRVNALLMDRLDEQGQTQKKTSEVIETQAQGMKNIVSSLDGNTHALREVQRELQDVKGQLTTLTTTVSGVKGLTDSDREQLAALNTKFDELLKKFEENQREKSTDDTVPIVPLPPAADAGNGAKPDAAPAGDEHPA